MTDYTRDVQNGTMMIRDTGGWVEFWFKTSSATFNHDQRWAYFDTAWHDLMYDLARGGAWQKLGQIFIPGTQYVTFRIYGSGLGWPTTELPAYISRARQPDPPRAPYFGERTSSQIHVAFDYNYDGGMGIDAAELWYSYDGQARFAVGGRDVWIGGLSPKTRYFFWGRVHNPIGWSAYSDRSEAWTVGVPDPPNAPAISAVNQSSVQGNYVEPNPWDGGSPIREFQLGYGRDPGNPTAFAGGTSYSITNLDAGQAYYFWSRVRNDLGWSGWSGRTDVLLPAGANVLNAGIYKRAIPWVKVNGVWRRSTAWTKAGGTWRITT